MEKLAAKNATKVIDLLTERLAFERSGVKLYDTLLGRLRATEDRTLKALLGDVKEHREEEKEHEEWLEGQIRALGGDAHAPTERSVLVQAESEGVERVMRRDDSILHDFHALLTAELADNAGTCSCRSRTNSATPRRRSSSRRGCTRRRSTCSLCARRCSS